MFEKYYTDEQMAERPERIGPERMEEVMGYRGRGGDSAHPDLGPARGTRVPPLVPFSVEQQTYACATLRPL